MSRQTGGRRTSSIETTIIDHASTSDKPHGPWPRASLLHLCAWVKLEKLEYEGKKHDTSIERVEDSIGHESLVVLVPYEAGTTIIRVDNSFLLDLSEASGENPFPLVNIASGDQLFVCNVIDQTTLKVLPTKLPGAISDKIQHIKSSASQPLRGQQPFYRRNVCNFMPSIRFTPPQMLSFDSNCLLQHRLSGPVERTDFALFFVTRTYSSVGSSPWPLFTAVDTDQNWSYCIQAVMEQRNNTNLEARWKISGGKGSEKTDGIDPTRFHILTILKSGRLMQLFVDGCKGHAAAQYVIEEDDITANINYIFIGADRTCSKFLDGELAEFLAYSVSLSNSQIDAVGKYLARRYKLTWTWNPSSQNGLLDSWLASRIDKGSTNKSLSGPMTASTAILPRHRIEQEIQEHVTGLLSTDLFMHSMEYLAAAALDSRKKIIILQCKPFDALFSYLDSADLAVRSEALRVICNLCHQCSSAQKEVMERDGLFRFLQCCEPTWKVELQNSLTGRVERFEKAESHYRELQCQLSALDPAQIALAIQLRLQLSKAEAATSAAKKEVDAIQGRLEKGLDESNSYTLQRESVKAIAALCDQNEEYQVEFTRLQGVAVLNRILETPSIPLKAAICKAVGVLVKSHEVAVSFIQNGLIHKISQLMLLDDPPLQCEASAVLLRVVQHADLREGVIEIDKLQSMILSEFEDNHVSSCKILSILSTHDDKMRAAIANVDGIVETLVLLCLTGNLLLQQHVVLSLAYLALDSLACAKLWKSGFREVAMELFKSVEITIVTHAIMAVANGCRNEIFSSEIFSTQLVEAVFEVGYRQEIGLQHLICGVFTNLASCRENHTYLLQSCALRYIVRMLKEGTLHAKYIAASFVRKVAHNPENAEAIVSAGALGPIVDMAKDPKILVDVPHPTGISQAGRSLYMHWQAGRCIAALTISPNNHMAILREGGIFALIVLCKSGVSKLSREGACALSYLADVRCEDEILLQMAESGAIPILTELARNTDEDTAADAEMALSSLLNFDSTWAN